MMERTVTKYKKGNEIRGVVYDKNNKPISRGSFSVEKDSSGKMHLKNNSTGKTMHIDAEDFDYGDDTPRRFEKPEIKKEGAPERKRKAQESKKFGGGDKPIKQEDIDKKVKELEEKKQQEKKEKGKESNPVIFQGNKSEITTLSETREIELLISIGLKNLWLVGPAGCGKSTMVEMVADKFRIPFLPISCGLGTSAAEFLGYKYPVREGTEFAKYYQQKSIILLDEFTALDSNVAQVCNSALANGFIQTTTGIVYRHPECIIIATSNTFGTGADSMYVSNNVLDASTIDRFTGGIIEVDYSKSYEKRFDKPVREHVELLRKCIKENYLKRIASTRSMIQGEKLKKAGVENWRERLVISWTDDEKEQLKEFVQEEKQKRIEAERERINNLSEKKGFKKGFKKASEKVQKHPLTEEEWL